MKHSTAAVLLRMLAAGLLLLLTSLPYGQPQGESVYYVKPTPDTRCPKCASICHTLSKYADWSFDSNTTLMFLSGNHTLNRNFTVMNISMLILKGTASRETRINCTARVAFLFEDILHVRISGLAFLSCGSSSPPGKSFSIYAAVLIISVQQFELFECILQENNNGTLFVNSSNAILRNNSVLHNGGGVRACKSNITLTQNVFDNNHEGMWNLVSVAAAFLFLSENVFINNEAFEGGAISANGSNITFSGNNSFTNNSAKVGGAILANGCNVAFMGNNSFINNSADVGGAISVNSSSMTFSGINIFTNNHAEFGGAIFATSSDVTFSGNSNFTINCAKVGGALSANGNNITFSGNNTFTFNCATIGGAISAKSNNATFSGRNSFTNNTAKVGGAISVNSSSVAFGGTNSFTNNSAEVGGAIVACSSNATIGGNNSFTNNHAESGGAISVNSSHANLNGNNTFTINCAEVGGAILANDSNVMFSGSNSFTFNCAEFGGAILVNSNNVSFSGNSYFTNNSAEGRGGAISANNSTATFSGNNIFARNSAQFGGAISANGSNMTFSENNSFIDNHAEGGGAISANGSNATFSGNNTFTLNCAEVGGAISTNGSNVAFSGNSSFTFNCAEVGGVLSASGNNVTFSGNNSFVNNSAEVGGTIWASSSSVAFSGSNSFINNSAEVGGAISVNISDTTFSGDNSFTNNHAEFGGAISAKSSIITFSGNNNFTFNCARVGGAISANSSNATFSGNNTFTINCAEVGGAISTNGSNVAFSGNNSFTNNTATVGGAISGNSKIMIFSGSNNFIGNRAKRGGTVYVLGIKLIVTGTINITNSWAESGGGIWTSESTIEFNGSSSFILLKNQAQFDGSGIFSFYSDITFSGISTFIKNFANFRGGGIFSKYSNITFAGDTLFKENNVSDYTGGGVYSENSNLNFTGISRFEKNFAHDGGGLAVLYGKATFNGESNFTENFAAQKGGGIYAYFNNLYFTSGNTVFASNSATNGGGLSLHSTLHLLPGYTEIYFINNYAQEKGGAMYVEDGNPIAYCNTSPTVIDNPKCFFQILEQNTTDGHLVAPMLIFVNNTAVEGGSSLYGGAVDHCQLAAPLNNNLSGDVFDCLVMIREEEPSRISSDPLFTCFCNTTGDCSGASRTASFELYPGGHFDVPLLAFGQRDGPVSAPVYSNFDKSSRIRFSDASNNQKLNTTCITLSYTVILNIAEVSHPFQLSENVSIFVEGPCAYDNRSFVFELTISPCPPGFDLSDNSRPGECVCDKRLRQKKYAENCNITDGTIERQGDCWVGYDNESAGLILHPHCPFDYCKPKTECVLFTLNNTDKQCSYGYEQCNYGRCGHLCGVCRPGQSLVLGNSHCHRCTNKTLVLLIPFALAGIALVVLLLTCRLTVVTGTINGLILYANIIAPNQAIFFPQEDTSISTMLTIFISWLNLDLGIETCFYDGMDAYARAWLQFMFPVYIWAIIGFIILGCRYSQRIAQLMGTNPVAVLATLILLSYAKLLRTVIAAFSFTTLQYPHDEIRNVWLYDGNVPYLRGKHIALFLAGLLMLVFLFLPYTLLLVTYQWVQAMSHLKLLSWLNNTKLKSFMDAYHAPHKPKQRYWTGLLLLVRFALLLTFGLNYHQDHSVNLLAIIVACLGLATLVWANHDGVYKEWYVDALEGSFILNLGILAAATYHIELSGGNQTVATYLSTGIAFATFTVILMYHLYIQVRDSHIWKRMRSNFDKVKRRMFCKQDFDTQSEEQEIVREAFPTVTATFVALREPLLEDSY